MAVTDGYLASNRAIDDGSQGTFHERQRVVDRSAGTRPTTSELLNSCSSGTRARHRRPTRQSGSRSA